jgi:hypothetical protein
MVGPGALSASLGMSWILQSAKRFKSPSLGCFDFDCACLARDIFHSPFLASRPNDFKLTRPQSGGMRDIQSDFTTFCMENKEHAFVTPLMSEAICNHPILTVAAKCEIADFRPHFDAIVEFYDFLRHSPIKLDIL